MKKVFSKKAVLIIVVAVLIAGITAVGVFSRNNPGFFTNSIKTIMHPFKTTVASVAGVCEKLYGYMHDFDRLSEDNARLRAELAGASQEERQYDELEQENQRLRELLGLRQRNSDYVFDTAAIISWSSSNWESTFTIGKGSANSDIEKGDCVISSAGEVVGIVQSVSTTSSICASIIDPTFSVSVLLDNVGGAASAKGDYILMKDGNLKLEYINDSNLVLNGDTVVTSGKGGVFPDGLLVGYIEEMRPNLSGLGEYAVIDPAADLDTLLNVYVITDFDLTE